MQQYFKSFYQKLLLVIIISSGIALPIHFARAEVIISEVAWMGTSDSANAEWIELYNTGNAPVDLTGWNLIARDGSPSILLTGSISAQGFFVLERTSESTLPAVTADQIFTGSLSNTGEYLELKDIEGSIHDSVPYSDGWLGGDNTTKETMQRIGASGNQWITAIANPREMTSHSQQGSEDSTTSSSSTSTATSSSSSSNNSSTSTSSNSTSSSSSSQNTSLSSSSTKGTPGTSLKKNSEYEVTSVQPDPRYEVSATIPSQGTVGTALDFSVKVTVDGKKDLATGKFSWYFGDGSQEVSLKKRDFHHTFDYPGEYFVVLEYASSELKSEPDSIIKKFITITDPEIIISEITEDGGIVLKNNGSQDILLHQWSMHTNDTPDEMFVFPKYSTLRSKSLITLSQQVHRFRNGFGRISHISLKDPRGKSITDYSE